MIKKPNIKCFPIFIFHVWHKYTVPPTLHSFHHTINLQPSLSPTPSPLITINVSRSVVIPSFIDRSSSKTKTKSFSLLSLLFVLILSTPIKISLMARYQTNPNLLLWPRPPSSSALHHPMTTLHHEPASSIIYGRPRSINNHDNTF